MLGWPGSSSPGRRQEVGENPEAGFTLRAEAKAAITGLTLSKQRWRWRCGTAEANLCRLQEKRQGKRKDTPSHTPEW